MALHTLYISILKKILERKPRLHVCIKQSDYFTVGYLISVFGLKQLCTAYKVPEKNIKSTFTGEIVRKILKE